MRGCWSPVRSAIERMLAASKPLSANSDNAACKIDSRVARERPCSARFLGREAPPTLRLILDPRAILFGYHSASYLAQRSGHLPSNVMAGGSISASKAFAVLAKPRCASAPLYSSIDTSSMTRSAAATPPLDQALRRVRVAA